MNHLLFHIQSDIYMNELDLNKDSKMNLLYVFNSYAEI